LFLIGLLVAGSATQVVAQSDRRGAPLKLIVTREVEVRSHLPSQRANADVYRARQHEIFFAVPTQANQGKHIREGYYSVALDTRRRPYGWLPVDACVEWPSRAVLASRESGFDHTFVYPQATRPGRRTATAKPIARCGEFAPGTAFPIVNGDHDRGFRVLCIGKGPILADFDPLTPQPPVNRQQREFTVDVVFVIDSTSSMSAYLGRSGPVREFVESTVARLRKCPGLHDAPARLRFGLVTYRDTVWPWPFASPPETSARRLAIGPAAAIRCRLSPGPLDVVNSVRGLRAAGASTDEWAENVLGGIMLAVESNGARLGWNATSSRHVILLGDASGHDLERRDRPATAQRQDGRDQLKNPQGLSTSRVVKALQARTAILHAIRLDPKPGVPHAQMDDDIDAARRQFRAMSGPGRGEFVEAHGPGEWAERISRNIESQAASVYADLAHAVPQRRPAEFRRVPRLSLPRVPVFKSYSDRRGETIVGWMGARNALQRNRWEVQTIVFRNELQQCQRLLTTMLETYEDGGGIGALAFILRTASGGRGAQSVGAVMRDQYGLPLQDGDLHDDLSSLRRAPTRTLERWAQQVRDLSDKIRGILEDNGRWQLNHAETLGDADLGKYTFLRLDDIK